MDKGTPYIIVQLVPGDEGNAEAAAQSIVDNMETVQAATPAFSDGFGRLIAVPEQRKEARA